MKILYVITGLGQGGAERVVCDLADEMCKRGHDVKIAYLTGDILTSPTHKEIELYNVSLNSFKSLPASFFKLSKFIKDLNPDVVHAHMVHANILARLVRILTPINKLICSAHNSNEGGALRMFLYRVTDRIADLTTNVSKTSVTSFEAKRAVPKNSMITVYNGVNFANFRYQPDAEKTIKKELDLPLDTKIILAVGRFNVQKNYPNLLMAIKKLKDQSAIPFILLIAGDGELRSEIETLILKLNIIDNVILLGRRKDIPKLMSACDVFVLSSDYEGLPTVLIEALACEAQVVSTDVSGVHEIINVYGKIVPIRNADGLAEAIAKTLLIEQKNILGHQYVKNKFDINIISDKWLKIYHED